MKPYKIFTKMWRICFISAGIAVFLLFLTAIILNLQVDNVSDVIIRLKNMNICAFILLAVSFAGFGLTQALEQFVMKKNEKKRAGGSGIRSTFKNKPILH